MKPAMLLDLESTLADLQGVERTEFLMGLTYKWVSTPLREWVGIHDLGHPTEQWELIQFWKPPGQVLEPEDVVIPDDFPVPLYEHQHWETTADLEFYDGEGDAYLDGVMQSFVMGTIINIPQGVGHGFVIRKPAFFLSVQPNPILKKDGSMDFHYVAMEKQPPAIVELKRQLGQPTVPY